ncbi:BatA and WFA domain-containing protein [Flavobacterium sp. Fl-77]|uniref:BatA and WFA domain-containing protein n=1 Tax=Flavobacterium flavipigmentatum TaxID=2893884 RepID=A0AAJ2VXG4_9FLAO|nr:MULTISPECIES: BatA and WFA domain-containing protein [unclassified Flavobacterium]MDX6181731.1 BatA and WFA domain-containing protein [Flavobacterium sp. Fl-33]MDX6185235.1 BatA and WFA domain-containing protein [Flavobacterium sp. Fl-77]UFH37341.1 BatA and WFA domain-containing protein [Flavobacterium sp. F-70]
MHFKQPEILYFLFLLIVPILVHLFQLRRFKTSYFTNVRFLKELSIQTRKSSKIKKRLLLATRLLLLACAIFAFAQPYFEAKNHKEASNEMYIILDNSFSMQAKGKKGELLKRAVQELLENTPENSQFSLLTNTENYWNTDIKSVRNDLQNLKYSATPFELSSILAKVKAHKSAHKKDIVIITDAVGLVEKDIVLTDEEDKPYFIIPEAEQTNNIAIDSVFIHQTLENFYEITVNLSAYGQEFKPVSTALYNQNKLIAKTIINFDTKKKKINFTIPKEAFHGYVAIEDNGLSYDNKLYFSISKTKKTNVISIGNAAKSNFLSRIYTPSEFNYNNYSLSELDYNNLEKQNTIILNELEEVPQALQTTLKAFVLKAGNVIVIPSEKSSISNLNTFLSNFGKIQFKNREDKNKLITKINFDHPLFSGVFENKISNFQYPKTNSSFSISSAYPAVLSYEDQSVFITMIQNPVSGVSVFSAPINSENSNFQQSPLIVPLFYKMAQNNQKTGVNAFVIGHNQPYFVDISLNKDAILEVKGREASFIPIQQILNNKVKLTFNDFPEIAGNYSVFDKNEWVENLSFNYSRSESDLSQVNKNAVSDFKTADTISTIFNTLQTERTDSQIWKWFVIFALLFLAIEMAIIKFVK